MSRLPLIAAAFLALSPARAETIDSRVHDIARTLRCPVCQGEPLDESDAEVARDLRRVLRERLILGDSDTEARAYLIARFGESISLLPDSRGANLILWASGPVGLLAVLGLWVLRRPRAAPPEPPLSPEERRQLQRRLDASDNVNAPDNVKAPNNTKD